MNFNQEAIFPPRPRVGCMHVLSSTFGPLDVSVATQASVHRSSNANYLAIVQLKEQRAQATILNIIT